MAEHLDLPPDTAFVAPPTGCEAPAAADHQLVRSRTLAGLAAPYGTTTPVPEGLVEFVAEFVSADAAAAYVDELAGGWEATSGEVSIAKKWLAYGLVRAQAALG